MKLSEAKKTLSGITQRVDALYAGIESQRISLGVELSEAFELFLAVPALGKFSDWAKDHCPGESETSVYRLKDAGKVARVIGETRGAKERTLQSLHKVLANGTPDEVSASEDRVRELWTQSCKGLRNGKAPTEAKVTEVLTAAGVTEGSRGPSKGSGSGKGKGRGKGKTGTAAVEPAAVEPAAIEAVLGNLQSQFTRWQKRNGIDPLVARMVFGTAVRYCETHGTGTVAAALATIIKTQKSAK